MASLLPSELWRRILQHACTIPHALDTPLRIGGNIDDVQDRTAFLQDVAKSRRATHKCIALVNRTWYSLSAEFFWMYLVLDSRPKVIGAATALYGSANNQNVPNPNRYPLYPRPIGGLGWFVHRIDMEFDLCATGTIDDESLRALVYILKSSPNLQVYSDISDSETPDPSDSLLPLPTQSCLYYCIPITLFGGSTGTRTISFPFVIIYTMPQVYSYSTFATSMTSWKINLMMTRSASTYQNSIPSRFESMGACVRPP
jgi:hypothetical protein